MTDRSREIFNNPIPKRKYRAAVKSKNNYLKKFGDDSKINYPVAVRKNPVLGDSLGIHDIRLDTNIPNVGFDEEKGIIVGNIRMGFGHYRISMAMASAANSMGYTPYWLDLNSFPETTATKVISAQNDLYSLGSRLSKNPLFNKLIWEPLNYEGFRRLGYNATDQKNAELMVPVFRNIPKDIPLVGTHVWPAQAAMHAGMKYVVNAIPDNWPMALHLAEGSVHTIQCRNSYMGYKILNGFDGRKVLNEMPADALVYTGHYVDDEIVKNIKADCESRLARQKDGEPMRFLLTIGGAGAQKEIFKAIIEYLIPAVRNEKATLFVNVGDYRHVWDELKNELPELKAIATDHMDNFEKTSEFADKARNEVITGVHGFWHKNIFEAVYATNLLMRICDVLVTKPSELSFYPVPKLFIRRVGKHEMWGAIHSSEMGDGTLECRDIPHTLQMIKLFMKDESLLNEMVKAILQNNESGLYDGAYKVVELAMGMKNTK